MKAGRENEDDKTNLIRLFSPGEPALQTPLVFFMMTDHAEYMGAVQLMTDPTSPVYKLPIMDGWNYIVRLYQPHKEILDCTWRFPAPQPIK
jgi:hypothetical protein